MRGFAPATQRRSGFGSAGTRSRVNPFENRPGPLSVTCPLCHSRVGVACVTTSGIMLKSTHLRRRQKAESKRLEERFLVRLLEPLGPFAAGERFCAVTDLRDENERLQIVSHVSSARPVHFYCSWSQVVFDGWIDLNLPSASKIRSV